MNYAIKRTSSVFWKTNQTLTQVRDLFSDEASAEGWEICPQGEPDDSVDLRRFLNDPAIFDNLFDEVDKAKEVVVLPVSTTAEIPGARVVASHEGVPRKFPSFNSLPAT